MLVTSCIEKYVITKISHRPISTHEVYDLPPHRRSWNEFFFCTSFHWRSKMCISLKNIQTSIFYTCCSHFFSKDFNSFLYKERTEFLSYNLIPQHTLENQMLQSCSEFRYLTTYQGSVSITIKILPATSLSFQLSVNRNVQHKGDKREQFSILCVLSTK
jgi:hypothetical protein